MAEDAQAVHQSPLRLHLFRKGLHASFSNPWVFLFPTKDLSAASETCSDVPTPKTYLRPPEERMMQEATPYIPKNKIRIVTAASLFDGHDAAINIMRRIIQSTGVEVIHLGHDRSVEEVVNCAIQEDAHAIAMTSYQGGHTEYFKYMHDLLKEKGAGHIKIFGGGGGTILPSEIEELQGYGITRIYHPDDGRAMGLQGMINDMVQKCDFALGTDATVDVKQLTLKDWPSIARLISVAENSPELSGNAMEKVREVSATSKSPVLGITGTGGAGKSSLVDELVRRFLLDFPEKTLAIVSVDPSKKKDRRCAAGRQDPDERHPQPAGVHALIGHPAEQSGAEQARAGSG